jgi:hypothetical protein
MIGVASGVLTTAVSTAVLMVLPIGIPGWVLILFGLFFLPIWTLGGAASGCLIGINATKTGRDTRRPVSGLLVGVSAMAVPALLLLAIFPEQWIFAHSLVALLVGAASGAVIGTIGKRISHKR